MTKAGYIQVRRYLLIFLDVNNHERCIAGDSYRYRTVVGLPAGPGAWLLRPAIFRRQGCFSFFGRIRKRFGFFVHAYSSRRDRRLELGTEPIESLLFPSAFCKNHTQPFLTVNANRA